MRASHLAVTSVVALVATTALTACSGPGTQSAAAAVRDGTPSASASAGAAGPSHTNATGDTTDLAGRRAAPTASHGRRSGSGTSPVDCAAASINYKLGSVSRPVNHALLTATNQGSVPCFLYGYPALRFTQDQQAVEQVIADSKPQAVVTLEPGQSAYAGIVTQSSDSDTDATGSTSKVTHVSVALQKRSGSFEGSAMTTVRVSGRALSVDSSSAEATYWQQDRNTALSF